MTAFNYAHTALSAQKMLMRFGAVATLRRFTGSTYDPNTGANVPSYTGLPTVAVVLPFETTQYGSEFNAGTLIQAGDQKAFLDPASPVQAGDKLTWQGVDRSIVAAKTYSPAGVPVLHEVLIRG